MSRFKYCDRRVDFNDWCEKHGFDADNRIDSEDVPWKRGVQRTFAIKHKTEPWHVLVTCNADYDWGEDSFEIDTEYKLRTEVPVTITQVKYVKADV